MEDPSLAGKLQITKLDAAKRQLETAIWLWFQDADPVSIHTIASAARQVLVDINAKRGGEPMGPDRPEIRPEARKRAREVFAEAANFFKHADRDPVATLIFTSEATRFYLLEAADKYIELAGELPPIFRAYILYHALTHPEVFKPQFVQKVCQIAPVSAAAHIGKSQFLACVLHAIEKTLAV